MKSIVILLTFAGILAITIGYINQIKQCPPPKIEYRYIPRTFEEEQNNPVQVSKIYRDMFEDPSVWMAGVRIGYVKPDIYDINKYSISQ